MEARKPTLSAATLTVAALIALATAAPAQAKEGTVSGTESGFGTYKAIQVGKDRLFLVFDENDLMIGNGIVDHMTMHCWGTGDYTKGVGQYHGSCVGTNPAGDQVALDFASDKLSLSQKSWKASWKYTAGSGKLAGITGGAAYVVDFGFRAAEKGTYFFRASFQGHYKLP